MHVLPGRPTNAGCILRSIHAQAAALVFRSVRMAVEVATAVTVLDLKNRGEREEAANKVMKTFALSTLGAAAAPRDCLRIILATLQGRPPSLVLLLA